MDRSLECFEVDRGLYGLSLCFYAVITDEQDGHQGRNGLDDLRRVSCRKTERLRINDNEVIVPAHDHLDRMGRVFDGLHIVAILPQHAVEAFYQNRIRRAEKDVLHDRLYSAYVMPIRL